MEIMALFYWFAFDQWSFRFAKHIIRIVMSTAQINPVKYIFFSINNLNFREINDTEAAGSNGMYGKHRKKQESKEKMSNQ